MNCRDLTSALGEYVDGSLDERSRAECEAHLDNCRQCHALAVDLMSVREAARTLEPRLPSPRVWSRIAAEIDVDHRGALLGWGSRWRALATSFAAATIVASLTWTGARLATLNADRTEPDGIAVLSIDAEFERVGAQFATTIAGLEAIRQSDEMAFEGETAQVLQANLMLIDGAIDESRTALETEPGNQVVQESLFEALRRKIELLQNAIALVNEMRKGNPEGAARIVSGLDQ